MSAFFIGHHWLRFLTIRVIYFSIKPFTLKTFDGFTVFIFDFTVTNNLPLNACAFREDVARLEPFQYVSMKIRFIVYLGL